MVDLVDAVYLLIIYVLKVDQEHSIVCIGVLFMKKGS